MGMSIAALEALEWRSASKVARLDRMSVALTGFNKMPAVF
jgi:hypothetical protein